MVEKVLIIRAYADMIGFGLFALLIVAVLAMFLVLKIRKRLKNHLRIAKSRYRLKTP